MYKADAHHENSRLQAKLAQLFTLRGGPTIDLTIRPAYYELLARLGDPHRHLPPVIHVAGTNGKGSTIAFLRAMLEAAGYRVHAYTSPHLLRFNERIVLAGDMITDTQLEALLDEVTTVNGDLPLTFFEITTALAFTAFARTPADIVLLETGLGGRLDCTNVIEKPALTVITAIGRDHCEFLGDTLEAIAAEKAGIMKPGVHCIIAPQCDSRIYEVMESKAAQSLCATQCYDKTWRIEDNGSHVTFHCDAESPAAPLTLPRPVLAGSHQVMNAGTALACLSYLPGFSVGPEAMAAGLRSAHWPARLQRLSPHDNITEIWVDGGHNESAAHALTVQCAHWQNYDNKPLHIIMGMLQTKNPEAFMRTLQPYVSTLTLVPTAGQDLTYDVNVLATRALACGYQAAQILTAPSLQQALSQHQSDGDARTAHVSHGGGSRVLICGSLYLAAEALSLHGAP